MENPAPIDLEYEGKTYRRLPLRTHVLGPDDTPVAVVERYVLALSKPGDIVFISETSVAIMQNRHRDHREITPGWLARKLSKLVTKSPYGVGLRSPYAMQYAIELAGVARILAGCVAHILGRVLGKKRWFYDVAGIQVRMMDAEHTMGVKEYCPRQGLPRSETCHRAGMRHRGRKRHLPALVHRQHG